MRQILLIGGDDDLYNDLLEYGERLGDCLVSRHEEGMAIGGTCDLIIMDTLAHGVTPIETIKQIARMEPAPVLGLLMNKDATGKRVQEAFFQYARAKGLRQAVKLNVPVFFGDIQALAHRQLHPVGHHRTANPLEITGEMLRTALKQHQFTTYFQPKIALKAGHIIGAEALVRWQHPEHGLITPDTFIPLIEEFQLMTDMTWLVLEDALRQTWEWRRLGYDFKVAVNFSASTFSLPGVAANVLAMIDAAHLDPECLSIELTESAMVQNLDMLLETILELYRFGIEIAIDDYGTGYSSLHQVSVIPASEIKVDQSFVRDMLDNPVDHLIVRNTVRMAHSLGMRALAEGVESKRQALALARSGCDEAQGYFFSRPVDAGAFLAYAGSNPSREVSRHFSLQQS